MAFPKTKTVRLGFLNHILNINKGGVKQVPDGWEELGEHEGNYIRTDGGVEDILPEHTLCGRIVHIGREKGKLFRFCPLCMVKVSTPQEGIVNE